MKTLTKEEFKALEKEYNLWLSKHPKGDHNYKSFTHMRRSLEFATHYNKKLTERI